MPQPTKGKIRNGTLILPRAIRKQWRDKEVVLIPGKGTLIVQALDAAWERYEEKLRTGKGAIETRTISEASRAAKRR
ncbi:MAG: hypothetical protein G01um101438_774 [Parcubacteria group bacterium Gr01-1014_38]|nr:MAG: hypothetical protein G01um101438_774 [Parcubacteria group bacterium Gr01-1014_38]